MRVDLLDRDGETLEQFRVISFSVNNQVGNSMQNLAKASLPPLLSVPAGDSVNFNWVPSPGSRRLYGSIKQPPTTAYH